MKIIHTSDWHLGHRLYNYDRTDEEEHFFEQLAVVIAKEQPDVLVVSGDIFNTGTPGNDVAKRFTERLLDMQAKCQTMETVVIAGNHDSYSRLVIDEALWSRCRVHVFGVPAADVDGKADFAKNVVVVSGKGVIAAVPFCHSRNFPSVDGSTDGNRKKNYFDGLSKYVADHADGLPVILTAHLAVKGELDFRGHDKALVIGGEECVDVEELGSAYDYVALGHIHCPQWIKGEQKIVRYCGTPYAIHFDETYDHGVDVVTISPSASHQSYNVEVRTEIFKPLHELVTLGGRDGQAFDDVLRQVAEAVLPTGTYIRLNVHLGIGELPGADWSERARKTCGAKGFRFCVNNPIRTEVSEKQRSKKMLTMAELRKLSDDEVLQILSTRHELTDRHREMIKSLMKEITA